MYDYLIIGAGFAGCVLAERIASQLDKKVLVIDRRPHIGGNAYDSYNEDGILIHNYGPHLFHTNDQGVFEYLSAFTQWRKYEHKVHAKIGEQYFPVPINRMTLNQYYHLDMQSESEVIELLEKIRVPVKNIRNSEDIIINQIGNELFQKFYRGYTKKQWHFEPQDLSPGVCGRIAVRTNNDDRYFTDKCQIIPLDGYTVMFKRMLSHPNIELLVDIDFKSISETIKFNKLIYTGPIDEYFDYVYGKLSYRSIDFQHEVHNTEWHQHIAQINYCDEEIPFTRVNEWKYITGQIHHKTAITKEYPTLDGEPFYPIPTESNHHLYKLYFNASKKLTSVYFVGRLAEYRYYNMDQVIARALKLFETISNV